MSSGHTGVGETMDAGDSRSETPSLATKAAGLPAMGDYEALLEND